MLCWETSKTSIKPTPWCLKSLPTLLRSTKSSKRRRRSMKLTRQPSHFFLFLSIIFPRTEKITKKRDHLLVSFFHFTKSLVRSFVRLLRIPLLLLHLFPLEWIEKRRERDRERPLIRFLGPARANQTKTRGRGLRSLAPGNTSRQGTFIQMHSARAFITLFGQK